MKKFSLTLCLSLGLMTLPSCSTDPNVRKGQTTGAIVGGLAGGLIDDGWGGAAVGAAAGALAGGAIAERRN